MEPIKVKDIMTSRVITTKPNISIFDAAKKMKEEKVGSLVVIKGETPVAMLTRQDIVEKVVLENKDSHKVLVSHIMSTPLVTCSPDDDLAEAVKRMAKHRYERLPVKLLNKIVGLLSIQDIIRSAPGILELLQEHFANESPFAYDSEVSSGDCELCGNYSEELYDINDQWVCDACKEEST